MAKRFIVVVSLLFAGANAERIDTKHIEVAQFHMAPSTNGSISASRTNSISEVLGSLSNAKETLIKATGLRAELDTAYEALETLLGGIEEALDGNGVSATLIGTPEAPGISVHLPEIQQMRGELATKSRVPVQWVVNDGATFQFQVEDAKAMIACNGLFMLPFEGLNLYQSWVDATPDWTLLDTEGKAEALSGEVDAFYQGMENAYIRRRASFVKADYLNSIHHKQLRVWYTIYEMFGYGVTLGESKGKLAMYPLMLSQPSRLDQMVFANYVVKGKSKGVRVSFVTHVDGNGDVVEGTEEDMGEYYKSIHGAEKCAMLFDPVEFPSQRRLVESKAESAMNFAATMAAGNQVICEKNGGECIEGGKPDKVIRFMKKCRNPPLKSKGWEKFDPSYGCQNDNGRVIWRTKQQYYETL